MRNDARASAGLGYLFIIAAAWMFVAVSASYGLGDGAIIEERVAE